MKKTNPDERDFDADMRQDPIVNLYSKILTKPKSAQPTPRILNTFRQLTQQESKRHSRLKDTIPDIFGFFGPSSMGWKLPVTLTLGIIVGIAIAPLWHSDVQQLDHKPIDQPVPGFRGDEKATKPGTLNTHESHTRIERTPEKWLEEIATLVYEGKISQALTQLHLFQAQYPDYPKLDD